MMVWRVIGIGIGFVVAYRVATGIVLWLAHCTWGNPCFIF